MEIYAQEGDESSCGKSEHSPEMPVTVRTIRLGATTKSHLVLAARFRETREQTEYRFLQRGEKQARSRLFSITVNTLQNAIPSSDL